jgi:hypothetical protein
MSNSPVISVLMSVFNGEYHVAAAMESILGQDFTEFEFIVIDDASTDGTWGILAEYASWDSRVRLIRHDRNAGLTSALNGALAVARGGYIARQDADDTSRPERFSKQLAFLQSHPEVGVLGTGTSAVTEAGALAWTTRPPADPMLLGWRLLFETCLAHSSVMFRSSLLEKTGPYNEEFAYAQDFELWSRMSAHTKLANLPEALVLRRVGPHSISTSQLCEQSSAAVRVIQRNCSQLLGQEVPDAVAHSVHRVVRGERLADSDGVIEAARLVRRLLATYLNTMKPGAVPSGLIKQDAASKLYLIAGRNLRIAPFACLRTAWWAQGLDRRFPSFRTVRRIAKEMTA